jgi:GTP-binding protein Era
MNDNQLSKVEQETAVSDQLDPLLANFPKPAQPILRSAWQGLPPTTRQDLLNLLPVLPNSPDKLRRLSEMAHTQMQMALGQKQRVAIVGPANVGKSTLYNQLIRSKTDRAEVSPAPGTTRANQTADAGLFAIVDTPGADAVGLVGEREREMALTAAQAADFLIIMFDAIQGIKRSEQALFAELTGLNKPYIVILNKMDLVGREGERVIAQAAVNLGLTPEAIVPLVAEKGRNLEQVVLAIVKAEPQLVAALGQALPAYRWQLAWRSITGAASTAGVIALTPLPLIDFLPLSALQIALVVGLARIYDYRITLGRLRELTGVLGMGFLGRTLFQQLSKLGGPPGWAVSAAVAAGTTVIIGYAAALWFDRGERLTRETMQQTARIVSDALMTTLKEMGRRRPSPRQMRKQIQETLNQISLELSKRLNHPNQINPLDLTQGVVPLAGDDKAD